MNEQERAEIRARYNTSPFGQLDKAEQDAIIAGLDFVDGTVTWPSTWVDVWEYEGFNYTIKPNAMGWSVWYGPYHIGQLQRMNGA
jgi:hypothetical protein